MHAYRVIELRLSTSERLRTIYWQALDLRDCQDKMLYTAQLKNGRACRGITGRTVYPEGYDGDLIWVAMRDDLTPDTGA